MSQTRQIAVNVYGINKVSVTPYLDAFQATLKAYPDKLTGIPQVYSRIEYVQGGKQMSAYVAETVSQIADLINGTTPPPSGNDLTWDNGDSLTWDDGDNVQSDP